MSAGERAIAKEMRREEKERKKRIRLANKMLIPASKKTVASLRLNAFDPDGTFFLEEEKWLRIYQISGDVFGLSDACKSLKGRIRITLGIGEESGRATCHLSLIETGEIYEEVRQQFKQDESVIKKIVGLKILSVDEAMNQIAANCFRDIRFSYASYVRGNKDWKKECLLDLKEDERSFSTKGLYGKSFQILMFPKRSELNLVSKLKELGCLMYVSMDLNALSEEERTSFKRAVEKKYNQRFLKEDKDFINLSISVVIFGDSSDAVEIVEETISSILLSEGYLIVNAFNHQGVVTDSVLSFDLVDSRIMRNVESKLFRKMMGGDESADAEVEIREDQTE